MPSKEGASEEPSLGEIRSDVRHLQADVTELKAEVRATNQKVDVLRVELTARIDRLDAKVDAKVDALRDSLSSAKIWALLLYFGLAGGMLFTMARGFKWI
jgi:outer membrane murein-binding lipoprotein Lpp